MNSTLQNIHESIKRHSEYSNPFMMWFGIFGAFNYPIFYLYWLYYADTTVQDLPFRVIATLLCLILAFKNHWPSSMQKLTPYLWYGSVIFCLPFFVSYNFFLDAHSSSWTINIILAMFWLILVLDLTSLVVTVILGVVLALFIHILNGRSINVPLDNLREIGVHATWIFTTSLFFIHRKEMIQQEKQRTLQMQAGAIAHEMRTPLFTLAGIGYYLKKFLPSLVIDHQKLPIDQRAQIFSDKQLKHVNNTSEDIEKVTRQGFSFIDIMLMNLREDFKDAAIENCSIKRCVEEALAEYPFGGDDRSMVIVQRDIDFEFKGNPLLIKHIFFNLLKNSIYYVKAANKGEILIKTYQENGINILSFKDTGTGIAPDILPHIFDKFYSKTKYGTGIGLAFCKSVMKGLGGDIRCQSQYGEYTEFILIFPPLEKS